jgi:hypothetical protein
MSLDELCFSCKYCNFLVVISFTEEVHTCLAAGYILANNSRVFIQRLVILNVLVVGLVSSKENNNNNDNCY